MMIPRYTKDKFFIFWTTKNQVQYKTKIIFFVVSKKEKVKKANEQDSDVVKPGTRIGI